MARERIVLIGGGPGGLLAARLLVRAGVEVTLFERLDPAATYGFGVALASRALDRLREHDPVAANRIAPLCHPLTRWTMRRDGQSASVEDRGAFGVERAGLLRTLQALASEAGVRIETGSEARIEDVADDADIVVLADGVGSLGREALAPHIGAEVSVVPIPFIWCGAHLDLNDSMTLDLRRTPHGIYCAHAMPYGDLNCTFQVDTVYENLRSAGLAKSPGGFGNDENSLRFLEREFSSLLGGGALLGNRSGWSTFRFVTCGRWSHDKFVLLGDAAHTAHYTVGSGTRMAMEDAIVLSHALAGESTVAAAFESYESDRRPAVEHLQWRATRSQTWWRTLAHRYDLPLPVLLFSYFTRTGSLGLEKLTRSNPEIVRAAIQHRLTKPPPLAAVPAGETVDVGVRTGRPQSRELLAGHTVRRRDLNGRFAELACDDLTPWSAATRAIAEDLGREVPAGLLLTGGDARRLVLDRFDLAEELRGATSAPVAVLVPESALDDAATAIAAGRTDLAAMGG